MIAGYDRRDAVSLPVAPRRFDASPGSLDGLRIGVSAGLRLCRRWRRRCARAFDGAVDVLADSGAEMVDGRCRLRSRRRWRRCCSRSASPSRRRRCMDRDAVELALSDAEFRTVVDKGKGYRGVDYMAATHRRDPASRPIPRAVRFGRRAGDADSGGHCLRCRHHRRGRDRRQGRRPASRLVALLVADQPRRAAGGEHPMRVRRGRPADRAAGRRALARRGGDLPDRGGLRGGAALGECPPGLAGRS